MLGFSTHSPLICFYCSTRNINLIFFKTRDACKSRGKLGMIFVGDKHRAQGTNISYILKLAL